MKKPATMPRIPEILALVCPPRRRGSTRLFRRRWAGALRRRGTFPYASYGTHRIFDAGHGQLYALTCSRRPALLHRHTGGPAALYGKKLPDFPKGEVPLLDAFRVFATEGRG